MEAKCQFNPQDIGFFCNPAKWAIDEFLSKNIEYDDYLVTEWQSEWFKPGQLDVVRVGVDTRSKKKLAVKEHLKPGIYGVVQVLSKAKKRPSNHDPFWLDDTMHLKDRLVVDIRYIRNMLTKPLLLEQLRSTLDIKDKHLLDGFQAATMPLDIGTFNHVISLTQAEQQVFAGIEVEIADTPSEIKELELKYLVAVPQIKETISKRIERGKVANEFKKMIGFKCMICESLDKNPIGFYKKDMELYIEVHHVIPLANLQPGSLSPSNLITVCANHHRQLHYGDVELTQNTNTESIFRIDNALIHVKKMFYG